MYLTAVPIAFAAFILAWFLREVPLRTAAGAPAAAAETLRSSASAADLGEALGGAPTSRTSAQEAERVLSRLSAVELRRFGYARLARAAGLTCPAARAGSSPCSPSRARPRARSWPSRQA